MFEPTSKIMLKISVVLLLSNVFYGFVVLSETMIPLLTSLCVLFTLAIFSSLILIAKATRKNDWFSCLVIMCLLIEGLCRMFFAH